jgi:processive 1,2-diacylglycerol beta-glucosyltransferase
MVTTDFETHRLWITQPCEHYFTATEEAALYLQCMGVPAADLSVTGIPVHPVFAEPKDRAACLARQQLVGDRPVVLLLAGGHGVGPLENLYRAVLEVEVPLEVVVVTGRNARARQLLEAIPPPRRHRRLVLGYTSQMDELMAVADLVVTKPGGLTTSESLARGAPLAIVQPVPGQEERNSDFLLENGAAIKVNHLPTLAHKLTALLRDPGRLAQVKAGARRLGRPRAAFDVVERSLAVLAGTPAVAGG